MPSDGQIPGAMLVVREQASRGARDVFAPEVIDSVATLASLAGVAMQGSELKDSQGNFFSHATEILVMALDGHDARKGEGAHHVAQIANLVGRELGLDEEGLRRLHFAALLSDIGILKMTAQQQQSAQHYARHPVIGHRILSRIRLWEPLAKIVLHHHDDFDGGGLEESLSGDVIPLESRIINAADHYAELTRAGRNRMQLTPSGAVAELVESGGGRFDPQVVAAFEQLSERGEL
jgi:response regulator RpfG family c-di-GMP phosphodiesterase